MDYKVYKYSELSDESKEQVKQWLLDDDIRNDLFHQDILEFLKNEYPNSDLKVTYSLSSCQGDGLNIYGSVKLYDVLPKLKDYTEKEVKTLKRYFDKIDITYTFERNNWYSYSCKFIDRKYVDDDITEAIDELKYWQYKNINTELLTKFYNDVIDHFEELDTSFEKDGYEYLYEMSDEEALDTCEANDYVFFEDGSFTKRVCAMEYI